MSSRTHLQVCILVFLRDYKYYIYSAYICSVGFRPENEEPKEKMITLVVQFHDVLRDTNILPSKRLENHAAVNISALMGDIFRRCVMIAITGCHIQVLHMLRAICMLNVTKYMCAFPRIHERGWLLQLCFYLESVVTF